jgi:O-antigen ligase
MTMFSRHDGVSAQATRMAAGMVTVAMIGACFGVLSIQLGSYHGGGEYLPIALIAFIAGLATIFAAFAGKPWAIICITMVLAIGVPMNFRHVEFQNLGLDPQNMAKLAAWVLAIALGLWHLPKTVSRLRQPHIAGFLIFALVSMASSAYSIVPLVSAGQSFGTLSFLLFVIVGAAILSPRQVFITYTSALAIYLTINLAVTVAAPDFSWMVSYPEVSYRLQALSGHPNMLGEQCVLLLSLLFVCVERRWLGLGLSLPLAAMGLIALELTNSRTWQMVLVLTVGVVLLRRFPRLLITALMLAAVAVLGLLLLPESVLDFLVGMVSRSGSVREILTLSDRTEIWKFCLGYIGEKPLFGWGHMASQYFLTTEFVTNVDGATNHPHNIWIQSLFSVGIIGTFPLLATFGYLLWAFVARPDSKRDILTFVLLFGSVTEISVFGETAEMSTQVFFGIMAACTVMSPAARRSLTGQVADRLHPPHSGSQTSCSHTCVIE